MRRLSLAGTGGGLTPRRAALEPPSSVPTLGRSEGPQVVVAYLKRAVRLCGERQSRASPLALGDRNTARIRPWTYLGTSAAPGPLFMAERRGVLRWARSALVRGWACLAALPATLLTAAAKVRVGGEEARDRVAQQRKLTARAKPVALAEARPHARGVRAVAHHNIPPRHCRAAMPARSAVRAETGMVRGCGCPGARPSENRRCSSAGSSSIAQSYGGPGRQSLGMYSHGMSPATIRHAPF